MVVQSYLYSCMAELISREALIGEAQGTGIDTHELDRVACSIAWHYYRVEVHQHLIVFQEEMIVHKDNSQGVFDMVFFQMLSKYFVKRISEALPDSNSSFATRTSGRELSCSAAYGKT